ncbi:MAG: (d)CMP kinase [Candidatus Omnitrophica bacterium]|nr:(d)CMP kinase [Candidatus Omnitrophota bacterium]
MPSNGKRPRAARPPLVVTIDGPGGVGKSTVAKLLARKLRVLYLDTGATYRALAYAALEKRLSPVTDVKPLARLARRLPLRLSREAGGALRVWLNGRDVSHAIRTERISEAAAQVSQHARIRAAMVALQRRLAKRQGVVVEGRDTGSVVFPQAPFKFFLIAAAGVRAKRRQRELAKLYGAQPPLKEVREQLQFRDELDRSRRVGPLVRPPGAVTIDTTRRTARQVVRAMLAHLDSRGTVPHRDRRSR